MKLVHRILFLLIFLSSCATRMIETDLYFGLTRPDGSIITEAEWKSFKENQITKVFTEGSTVVTATGTWYDPHKKELITEPTYVVVYYYKKSKKKSIQIDSLRASYQRMFQQQSVLRVDKKVKASF